MIGFTAPAGSVRAAAPAAMATTEASTRTGAEANRRNSPFAPPRSRESLTAPTSEPERLIAADQLDVDARMPEDATAAWLEHVLATEDGAALVAADEDTARDGGDAADRLVAVAVVELVAGGVVGGQPASAHRRGRRVPA